MLKVHLNFHIAGHFIREPFIIIITRQSTALRDDYTVHKFEHTLLTGFPSMWRQGGSLHQFFRKQ